MELGISIGWDYLSGINKKEESTILSENFNSPESYLRYLKESGVTSIELRRFGIVQNLNEIKKVCKFLKDNNFSITSHGDITENDLNLDIYSIFPWLKDVLQIYNDRQLIIVVHPIEGINNSLNVLYDISIKIIKKITEAIEKDNLNVKIAVEINQNYKKMNQTIFVNAELYEHNLNMDIYSIFPWLKEMMQTHDDKEIDIVIQPVKNDDKNQEITKKIINNLNEEIKRKNLQVKIILDTNQIKETLRIPGYTYDSLLKIVSDVNSKHLGICFDFGHAWSNVRRGFIDKAVPDEFLNQVIHAHVHDTSPKHQTHWPLLYKNVPIEDYSKQLIKKSYNGVFNIELELDRFKDVLDIKNAIESSIKNLDNIIKNIQN